MAQTHGDINDKSLYRTRRDGFLRFRHECAGQAETAGQRLPDTAYQAATEMRASKLVGVTVKNEAGEISGDINDVVFQENGQISTYFVGVGGFLGVGEKNVGVPCTSIKITNNDTGLRTAILDATKAQLEAAPSDLGEKATFEKVLHGASDS
jgi:sporulation protein YlmC with PRC-barrel domain